MQTIMLKILNKLYDKSDIWFSALWIVAYCVLFSAGDYLSELIGIGKLITLVIGLLMSALLLFFVYKSNLAASLGLCRPSVSARSMLYYIPLLLMMGINLIYGVTLNLGALETVLYVLTMLCVGFLEEMIFRGLLFSAMRKSNITAAVIVSAVTFGIGHIINLVNGSGAELLPNLLQVVYATAAGFMFVMIYYRSESLIACIGAHGLFNSLSVFANEANMTLEKQIISCVILTVLTGGYALYIALVMRKERNKNEREL